MEQKIECSYVRDLLPLYIDEIVSDETQNQLTEHLKKCESCRAIYQDMKKEVADMKLKNIDSQKNFLKQIRKSFILNTVNILMGLAIVICFIVNLAVNHGITWFPIAAVSILFGNAIVNTLVASMQHKVFNSMIVISVGLIVLLTIIQASGYYLLGNTNLWYFKFGLPLAIIWLVIVWIPVLLNRFCKFRVFDALAILCVCILIGNYVTKIILGDIRNMDALFDKTLFMQNGLEFLIGAIIFIFIGRIQKWKK